MKVLGIDNVFVPVGISLSRSPIPAATSSDSPTIKPGPNWAAGEVERGAAGHGSRTAAPFTRSAARSASASGTSFMAYGVTVTRSR
jgi:hypothetical protein